jgi:hypothetical protein
MNSEDETRADAWAGRLIDDDDASHTSESMDDATKRQLADQLLVDALLTESLCSTSAADRENRMARLLDSLPAESASPSHVAPSRRRWITSVATFAACVSLMLTFWTWAAPMSAEAAVEKSLRQAECPIDRHYVLTMTGGALDQTKLDLYLRGKRLSCFQLVGPLKITAWVGINAEHNWLVPKVGPVVVARDFSELRERLLQSAELPVQVLQIADIIRFVRDDFEVTLTEDPSGTPSQHHIEARKRPGFRPLLPDHVDLWADKESGLITRAVLQWLGPVEKIAVRTIEFKLVDETPRSVEWYEHHRHHEPDRPVIRL